MAIIFSTINLKNENINNKIFLLAQYMLNNVM
jgi:hypothetical protein